MCLLFILLIVGTIMFVKRGRFGPPWAGQPGFRPWSSHSPEGEAKKILAERFARGDISTDEFMERASVLNWTPGSDPFGEYKPKKKR